MLWYPVMLLHVLICDAAIIACVRGRQWQLVLVLLARMGGSTLQQDLAMAAGSGVLAEMSESTVQQETIMSTPQSSLAQWHWILPEMAESTVQQNTIACRALRLCTVRQQQLTLGLPANMPESTVQQRRPSSQRRDQHLHR